jgi:hypothetical protein
MLLPPKNPKLLIAFGVDVLAGRLGFEPRQSAPKALDLPLVDRPVRRRFYLDLTIDRDRRGHPANIPLQYSARGKVSVRKTRTPVCDAADWTRC